MSSFLDLYSLAQEPIVVIRRRHLDICDNNHCAAALLDEFYAQAEEAEEYSDPRYDQQIAPYVYSTYSKLTSGLFGLFDVEAVRNAFMLLIGKGYIKAWQIGEIGSQDEIELKILCDRSKVMQACEPYYAASRARQEKQQAEWKAQREAQEAKLPPPLSPQALELQRLQDISNREASKVYQHLNRAKKLNLPATLSLDEWISTLNYFEWKCAYCQEGDYESLEHFIPLSMDGGTTQSNCVPSCRGCNGVKKSYHPYQIPFLHTKQAKRFLQGLSRVHEYLVSCGCEEVAP